MYEFYVLVAIGGFTIGLFFGIFNERKWYRRALGRYDLWEEFLKKWNDELDKEEVALND